MKPAKFLGDQWTPIAEKLKALGMTWGRADEDDPKSGRWVGKK